MSLDPASGGGRLPLAKRVYDGEEVDAYLSQVNQLVGDLRQQLKAAVDRAELAERRAVDTANAEALIGRTLLLAQRAADDVLAHANHQAEVELAAARSQVDAMLSEARRAVEGLTPGRAPSPAAEPFSPAGEFLGAFGAFTMPPFGGSVAAEAESADPWGSDQVAEAPPETVCATPGMMVDLRHRWRAARSGTVAVFDDQFSDDRPDSSDFLAELRLALTDETDLSVDARRVDLLGQSLAVDQPAQDVIESGSGMLALAGAPAVWSGDVSVTNRHDRRLASFGWLMLSVVAPARMAHRHRRGRPRR